MGKKILIVEDESVVALDIEMMLEHLGYLIPDIISQGEAVLAAARKTNPDLVLMDIHLTGKMDGIEAANALRLEFPNLPVIFLTAFVDEVVLQRASLTGSFGYILKPFEERELMVNIQMALYKAQLEQTLRDREAYFRTLIENSTDIISIIDTTGITRFVSPSVYRVLGYRPEELIGQNAFAHVHPLDGSRFNTDFHTGIQSASGISASEFRFRHKNGSWRTMEIHASAQTENPLIGGVIINARDITERAEMAEALRVERDKAKKYLDTARVILLVLNERGEVTLINPYALETLGYLEEEILGKNWFELCVPPAICAETQAWHTEMLGGTAESAYSREHPILNKRGETHYVAWQNAPLTSEGGHINSILFSGEDITARRVAEEHLRYNALHDALTGLPNRAFFLEALANAIDHTVGHPARRFAVLFLDLDSFKLINDSFGHSAGDKLLVATARRLEASVRAGDVVARLSGDEFFILLDDVHSPPEAVQVANSILSEVQKPLTIEGKTFQITCSIGIVLCNEKNQFVEDILRDADIAMYQAKSRGKGGYAFFLPDMRTQPITRLHLENDLRQAVEQYAFTLNYQPISSLQDDRLVGFEALVRWNHPAQGPLSPAEFIPILEETGLIIPAGEWILNRACQQIADWQKRFPASPPLSVSVNVSARQFTHSAFVEQVHQALTRAGLDPKSLKLELTESVFLSDTELARSVMYRINDLGVGIHIDDFGTGYSSLSYLQTLPFEAIKIDRSFISHIDTEKNQVEIVKSILALANTIGACTIAEGLEKVSQLQRVKEMGCKFGQGFYIARPLDVPAVEALLRRRSQAELKQPAWVITEEVSW